ncbi:unnamed protein product [Parnassius apollo]|uniref:(apollo) hypothetical protein n=1 Tax=Parnassius apollo TaxID=110799 RepID=A0A8S3WUT1_PARAO|nr:unnamed protein product [Parnassius apollo]
MAESLFSLDDNAIGELLEQSDLEDVDEDDDDLYVQNDEDNNSYVDDVPLSSVRVATNQSDGKWTKKVFEGRLLVKLKKVQVMNRPNHLRSTSKIILMPNCLKKIAICTAQYYMAEKGQQMRLECTPNEIKKILWSSRDDELH